MEFIFLLIAVSFLTIRQLRNKVGWQQALPKFSTKSIHLEMLLPLIIFCTSLIDTSVPRSSIHARPAFKKSSWLLSYHERGGENREGEESCNLPATLNCGRVGLSPLAHSREGRGSGQAGGSGRKVAWEVVGGRQVVR